MPRWGVTIKLRTFVIYHQSQIRSETISRIKEMFFLDKIKHTGNFLSELDLYKTYRITDASMGIGNKSHTRLFPTDAIRLPLITGKISSTFLGFLNFQFLFTTTSLVEIFPALYFFSRLIREMKTQVFK